MTAPPPREAADELYLYAESDIVDRLSDAWVDMREHMTDEQAAEALDIAYCHLTAEEPTE